MFKKEKFPLTLFVASSFLALIMFLLLMIMTSLNSKNDISRGEKAKKTNNKAQYYLNEDFNSDPLITKTPSWENLLAGPIISSADPSIGKEEAKVNIVVFSDFVCDYCAAQEEIYKKIISDYGDEIRFIWKDYPENDIDSISFQAALAARCAQAQDKFWPYHDLLFANNKELNEAKYYDLANEIGLDANVFKDCLANKKTFELVANNMKEADALEITGIPFVYINDQEFMGEVSAEVLDRVVQVELNQEENQDNN